MPRGTGLALASSVVLLSGAMGCTSSDESGGSDGAQSATAHSEEIELRTSDGVRLTATFWEGSASKAAPAVILIHQGGSSRKEWSPFADRLSNEGFVVLSYDVRGHGDSDPVEEIRQLFDDPALAPKDLLAAIEYLQSRDEVDPKRIGVVGSSIGSNLACVASSEYGVKSAVAISGKTSAVYNLAGTEDLQMKSVFHISSEKDGGGDRAKWARELFEQTAPPRRVEIAPGGAHGVGIFEDAPRLPDEILGWLRATL